jgi:serine palmitoyltransferase
MKKQSINNTVLSKKKRVDEVTSVLNWFQITLIYFAYTIIFIFAALREFFSQIGISLGITENKYLIKARKGYAPLLKPIEGIFLHRVYQRVRDAFERPISSTPGSWFKVLERYSDDENFTWKFTGKEINCLNLGSYNYLGFAETSGTVTKEVEESIKQYGAAFASPRMESGDCHVTRELEKAISNFIGKEDALVIGMGYATNSTSIPAICGGKGCLIISDSLNHNSIVSGSRDSGSKVLVFKHNNPDDLEKLLRNAIVEGQPRTRRPWKKIVIIVEGIYSMEGEICNLPALIEVKKKYKAYLYVDEAHSIGALGHEGRGVCQHWGVNPDDVDVLMGTFTKAFGSVGGYIAGRKEFIEYLRNTSYGSVYSTSMSAPCAQQALSALQIIQSEEGAKRISKLHENSNYFREKLQERGFVVFGDRNSPIIPMMLYHLSILPFLTRFLLERKIAIVIVGFPVCPLLLNRIRFCISASHTREDLDYAISQIDQAPKYFPNFHNM